MIDIFDWSAWTARTASTSWHIVSFIHFTVRLMELIPPNKLENQNKYYIINRNEVFILFIEWLSLPWKLTKISNKLLKKGPFPDCFSKLRRISAVRLQCSFSSSTILSMRIFASSSRNSSASAFSSRCLDASLARRVSFSSCFKVFKFDSSSMACVISSTKAFFLWKISPLGSAVLVYKIVFLLLS